jgi:hypothetical protein
MPFHVGGHKPHVPPSKRVVTIKDRLLVTMFGCVFILGGWLNIERGYEYGLNLWGEPVYAYGLILVGAIVIPLAWIPSGWIERAVAGRGRAKTDSRSDV